MGSDRNGDFWGPLIVGEEKSGSGEPSHKYFSLLGGRDILVPI